MDEVRAQLDDLFNSAGRQYELLVYEKSRREAVALRRKYQGVEDYSVTSHDLAIADKIKALERFLNQLSAMREQFNHALKQIKVYETIRP